MWNLSQNRRTLYFRGAQGAWFSPADVFYGDFPKFLETPRTIGTAAPNDIEVHSGYALEDDVIARQQGRFLLVTAPKGKNRMWDSDLEVRETVTNQPVWSRHFAHEIPSAHVSSAAGTILLGWSLAQPGGHEELQKFPNLKSQATKDDYLYEVINLERGDIRGSALIKTNKRSVRLEDAAADGDWLVVSAAGNQVLTFSLASGLEKGHFFGVAPHVLGEAGILALEKDATELDLYDLDSQQLRRRYVFADPIEFKRFSADGKRLLVLTATQTVYLLDTSIPN